MKLPEKVEGDIWLLCKRPWVRSERESVRRRRKSLYRTHLKRAGRRVMRRLGRLLLDDAPRKLPTRGWEW
jgi:hypothetical protein